MVHVLVGHGAHCVHACLLQSAKVAPLAKPISNYASWYRDDYYPEFRAKVPAGGLKFNDNVPVKRF